MIRKMEIRGFKSMKHTEFPCRDFNLFVGTNSSGKSSAIQAILLLAQNTEELYGLNGPFVALGEFREVKSFLCAAQQIEITVLGEEERDWIQLKIEEGKPALRKGEGGLGDLFRYGNGRVHYLSCNRIGTQDVYQKNRSRSNSFGVNGEFAVDYLVKHGSEPLEEELLRDRENYTLLYQTNLWLDYIVNASISVEDIVGTNVVKASYSMADQNTYVRPVNIGSGISYLISILALCLGSRRGEVILVENPEIHLHPLSQSRLCEFLYFIACAGRQIFVETHSDHFFNGVRAGIATQNMERGKTEVLFFSRDSAEGTVSHQISIGKRGKIENPISRLFDQFDEDLDRMLGI